MRFALMGIGLIIFIAIVAILGVLNARDSDTSVDTARRMIMSPRPRKTDEELLKSWNGIRMTCNVTSVDPDGFKFSVHFGFKPSGDLVYRQNGAENTNNLEGTLGHDIQMLIEDRSIYYKKGSIMSSEDLSFTFTEGNFNNYPFDKYVGDFSISAEVQSADYPGDKQVPVILDCLNAVQGWKFFGRAIPMDKRNRNLSVRFTAVRSTTSIAYSIYIIIVMWALSLSVFSLAMVFLVQKKDILANTIGLCTGMLFALPNVRSVQPGSPPLGCTADVIGFFWNILLVAVAGISLLIVFVLQTFKPAKEDNIFKRVSKRESNLSTSYYGSTQDTYNASNSGSSSTDYYNTRSSSGSSTDYYNNNAYGQDYYSNRGSEQYSYDPNAQYPDDQYQNDQYYEDDDQRQRYADSNASGSQWSK